MRRIVLSEDGDVMFGSSNLASLACASPRLLAALRSPLKLRSVLRKVGVPERLLLTLGGLDRVLNALSGRPCSAAFEPMLEERADARLAFAASGEIGDAVFAFGRTSSCCEVRGVS